MEEVDVVKRLAQFVLNRQTDDMRKELHEFIVGMVLFSNGDFAAMSISQIREGIHEVFGLESFPESPIENAILSMIDRHDIEVQKIRGENRYSLSQQLRTKLGVFSRDYDEIRGNVESELILNAKKSMPEISVSKQTLLIKSLDLVFGRIIAATSKSAASACLGSPYERIPSGDEGLSDDIDLAVSTYFRGQNRNKVKEVITRYLEEPTENLAAYLHAVSLSYFIFEVLHLDPECQNLTKDELSKRKFYLDTNAVINLLTGNKKRRRALERLVEISTNLGMTPVVTSRTKQEFISVLNYQKVVLSRSSMPVRRYEKVSSLVADDFLKDFMEKKKQNQSLTVEGYFARLELVEKVLEKWGIVFEEVDFSGIPLNPDYDGLLFEVIALRPNKSDGVAEHDTSHILWIDEMRKSEEISVTGPNYWLLTFDISLPIAERVLIERNRIQVSINPDQWIQMLSPFLAPDISSKEMPNLFATLFATRLPAASPLLRGEDLLKIQGPWIDDEDLGEKELKIIIGSSYVQSYLRETPYEELSLKGFQKALEPLLEEVKGLKVAEAERLEEIESTKKWLFGMFLLLSLAIDILALVFVQVLLFVFVPIESTIVAVLREEVRAVLGLKTRSSDSDS